jgi:molybdopterin converting factor small subunit
MASKMLHVSTAGGRQFDVELEEGETIATLKKKLFELIREAQQRDKETSW